MLLSQTVKEGYRRDGQQTELACKSHALVSIPRDLQQIIITLIERTCSLISRTSTLYLPNPREDGCPCDVDHLCRGLGEKDGSLRGGEGKLSTQ